MEGFTQPKAVFGCGSDVASPGGRQLLPEEGADSEAVLEAAVTTAGFGPEMRQSRTFLM